MRGIAYAAALLAAQSGALLAPGGGAAPRRASLRRAPTARRVASTARGAAPTLRRATAPTLRRATALRAAGEGADPREGLEDPDTASLYASLRSRASEVESDGSKTVERWRTGGCTSSVRRRRAKVPRGSRRRRDVDIRVVTCRGDAAGATWMLRGSGRGNTAAASWIVRGDVSRRRVQRGYSVDRVAATPRPRAG